MTREEKIKGLYSLKEYLVENSVELEGYKSLPITLIDYAIEALEQESCEDAISRQAAIDALTTARDTKCVEMTNGGEYIDYEMTYGYVEELPPVNPIKTGHWIDSPNGYFTQCSECGLHGAIGIYKNYGWCPKCGAKMVEPQESEAKE